MRQLIIFSLLLASIFSCKRHNIKDDINNMLDSRVKLDSSNMVKLNSDSCQAKHTYTIIRYFDEKECQSCAITKLHSWDNIMHSFVKSNEQSQACLDYAVARKSASKNQRLSETCNLLFVLSAPHSEVTSLEILIKSQKTNYNLYVDTANIFRRDNPFVVDNPMLHTFLVDNKNRKTVVVGNPLDNKEIRDMMLDKIMGHNN